LHRHIITTVQYYIGVALFILHILTAIRGQCGYVFMCICV